VYWSLAVEEHYYLTYPLLAYYLLKKGDRRLSALVLFGVGLLVLGWRAYLMSHGAASSRAYLSSDTRIDSILWGCLLALCCNPVLDPPVKAGRLAKLGVLGLSGAVLLSTFVYRDPFFRQTYRYTLQGLALLPAFYLAVSEARWGVFRWLGYAPVRHFGVLSYTFYLVHHLMLYSAEHLAAELNQVLRGGLVFVLALVYSELSLRYLERPIARLRAHYR
jgi:peptidoglycan/LPS O-acetylase OafA/YrhL